MRTRMRPRRPRCCTRCSSAAASYGVLGLDDLIALPSMRAHPSAAKLALTARLPRAPGVYVFRDRDGRVLYVGKASNLRARVRSYFASDDRRKVPQLLRELVTIDHRVCASAFEAEVRELRLIQRLQPRFNRHGQGGAGGGVPEADRRALSPVDGHPHSGGGGLGARTVPVGGGGASRAGSDRDGGSVAALCDADRPAGGHCRRSAVCARAARRGRVPVPGAHRRRHLCVVRRHRAARAHVRARGRARRRSRRGCTGLPTRSGSRRRRGRATGSRHWPGRCNGGARSRCGRRSNGWSSSATGSASRSGGAGCSGPTTTTFFSRVGESSPNRTRCGAATLAAARNRREPARPRPQPSPARIFEESPRRDLHGR